MADLWTNDTGKRLYLTPEGDVVADDDPRMNDPNAILSVLVGPEGQLPLAQAEKLGLTEKAKAAPANKAKPAPPNKAET